VKYFVNRAAVQSSLASYDRGLVERLWMVSAELARWSATWAASR
jgi:hypothetical protein